MTPTTNSKCKLLLDWIRTHVNGEKQEMWAKKNVVDTIVWALFFLHIRVDRFALSSLAFLEIFHLVVVFCISSRFDFSLILHHPTFTPTRHSKTQHELLTEVGLFVLLPVLL